MQCDASNVDVNYKLQMEAQPNGLPKHMSGAFSGLAAKVIRKASFENGVREMHRMSSAHEGSSTASTCSDSISLSSLPIRALFEQSRTGNQLDATKTHLQVSRQYSPNFPMEPPPPPPPRLQGPPPTPPRGTTPPSQPPFLQSNQMQHILKRISPGPQTTRPTYCVTPSQSSTSQSSTPQRGTSPVSIGRSPQHQLNHQLQSALYSSGVAQMEPPPPYPIGCAQATKLASPPPYSMGNNRQSPTQTSDYSTLANQIQKRVSPTVCPPYSTVTSIATSTALKPAPLQAWNARQPPPIMLSVKSTQVQKPVLQTAVAPVAPPMTALPDYVSSMQQNDFESNYMCAGPQYACAPSVPATDYMCAGVQYACAPSVATADYMCAGVQFATAVPTTDPPSYASTMQAMAAQRGAIPLTTNANNSYTNYSVQSSSTTMTNVMNNFESQLRTASPNCVTTSTVATINSTGHPKVSHVNNYSPVSSTHSEFNENRHVNGQTGETFVHKPQPVGWNVSPIPERKLYAKEKEEDEGCETKVRNYSPQAFKFYMEQHVENVLKCHQQRLHRRHQLETEMAKVGLSEEAQFQMRKMLHQKESNYIRLKRAKMDKAMFVKIKSIGVGAFGEVALVRKLDTQHLYAMKTLKKTDVLKRNQVAHVKAERDILAEADNEWVVKLYYSFQDQDNLYFVMDYIPGGDLMSLLIKLGIFEEPLARFYIAELVCAVESVHKMGFIHRDIKPDNILIDRDGHIKLTDFGLCTGFRWTHNSKYYQNGNHSRQDSMEPDEKWTNDCQCNSKSAFREKPLERRWRREHQRCLAHSLVGTPNYIAPEVLIREGYTQMCDWWSVGVILYEMLVGQPPFLANTPLETQVKVINWKSSLKIPRAANVSPEAEDLILKLCTTWDKRLGKSASEVKTHPYFANIDFKEGLRRQPAPFTPTIRSPTDTSNFDPVDPDRLRNSNSDYSDDNGNFGFDNAKHPEHAFFEFTFRRFFDDGGHAFPTKLGVGMMIDGDNQGPVYLSLCSPGGIQNGTLLPENALGNVGLVGISVNDNFWNWENTHQFSNGPVKTENHNIRMATLESLRFDNLALRSLPLDKISENYTRSVNGACFSRVVPSPVECPETVAYSSQALSLLDLPEKELQRSEFPVYFSGNKLLPGSETASHCYCGHQFGSFAGQLGDGAAIYLGEIVNKNGERWELQLKGAGKTPFSRAADGRKVLRSSIREFLCSEAMHNLGIATTRAGSCVTSSSTVIRDIFYDGHPIKEKCSIVFGSFEIFKTTDPMTGRNGPSVGQLSILKQLIEYTISTFYPEIKYAHSGNDIAQYRAFYKEVVTRTAKLVANWQCVGFCHGVLNTDNMSIVGLTIDYGPFGFMDRYHPDHICNSSDDGGRYTYVKQPEICKWNLMKLAEALAPFLPLEQSMQELAVFEAEFDKYYQDKMRKKLGLVKQMDGDKELIQKFLNTLEAIGADFTNSFRCLSSINIPSLPDHAKSVEITREKILSFCCSIEELKESIDQSVDGGQLQFLMLLYNTQPQILEQIGRGKEVIERELERRRKLNELKSMTNEEKINIDREKLNEWLKIYIERISKETLGNKERVDLMNANNPKYILRNYIAQNAISLAEKGDYSEVKQVLKLLENPFADEHSTVVNEPETGPSASAAKKLPFQSCKITYDGRPPSWAGGIKVS
uniref:non-specific serine/threonine protein kinase n=1 Tax=Strigamia maritima TaxID=126957 RepID=T1ILI2_STRMM